MATGTHWMTAQQLLQSPPNGPCELIEGELRMMSPADDEHGRLAGRLAVLIGAFLAKHKLGAMYIAEPGFQIASDPDTVRAPDIGYVRKERLGEPESGFFQGAPDFACEVMSPSDRLGEVKTKAQAWLDAGSLLVWVILPTARAVTVYRPNRPPMTLGEEATLSGEGVLPGFECKVSELFE